MSIGQACDNIGPSKTKWVSGLFASDWFQVEVSTAEDLSWVLVFDSADCALVTGLSSARPSFPRFAGSCLEAGQ